MIDGGFFGGTPAPSSGGGGGKVDYNTKNSSLSTDSMTLTFTQGVAGNVLIVAQMSFAVTQAGGESITIVIDGGSQLLPSNAGQGPAFLNWSLGNIQTQCCFAVALNVAPGSHTITFSWVPAFTTTGTNFAVSLAAVHS